MYARLWRGIAFSTFVQPALYLAAMGIGLGGLVSAHSGSVDGLTYLDFVAPGLLVASAAQLAASESMWPVLGGAKWMRQYHGVVATPIAPGELYGGFVLWTALHADARRGGVPSRRRGARRDPVGVGCPRGSGRGAVRGRVLRAARRRSRSHRNPTRRSR